MILHTVYPGTSGATSVAINIYQNLEKKNKKKNCLVFFGKTQLKKEYKKIFFNKKLLVYKIIYNYFFLGNLKFLLLLFKTKPKSILMHNYLILPIIFYKLFFDVKLITVFHTNLEIIQDKIKENIFFKIIIFFILFFSKKIVLVNKLNKNTYLFNNYKNKLTIIPNCVEHNIFKRKNKNHKKKIVLGTAGRLVQNNKISLVIDAISKLRKNNLKLLIAGNGPDLLKLKQKVKKYKLSKKIIFFGDLDKLNLINWFNKITIYIHFSKKEFMSTSILQAMSLELPVMATDLFENRFVYEASKTKNILVDNKIENISHELDKLLRKKVYRSRENRKFIKKINNIEIVGKKYQSLLK